MISLRRSLSLWSIVTFVLAVPVWWTVGHAAILSRAVDGGIFLSVSGGIKSGLPLYTGVWDNKDPFFFLAMTGASYLGHAAPFFMDLLWIPLGAFGGWLIARSIMSADRALFVALILVPLALCGPFYIAGWSNTPGTALVLLIWGLAARRWNVAAGIVCGLLLFIKITLWPVALIGLLVMLAFPAMRRGVVRALIALAATVAGSVALLAILGWLGGYLDAFGRNRTYASDVIVYFGFEDSPFGHLAKLQADWAALSSASIAWVPVVLVLVVLVFAIVLQALRRSPASSERILVTAWLAVSILGVLAALALTYVWPHHAQAIYLPVAMAMIVLASLIPARWPFLLWAALILIFSVVAAGWGPGSSLADRVTTINANFDVARAEISEIPKDARILNTAPLGEFTYARLGSNDDRGYLADVRDGAVLACPAFHLYDFSPASAWSEMYECIQTVDAVVKTDAFDVFGNGGKAANVQPILNYVNSNFTCLRVEDRQLCIRK